jgi:hypothetical protein
MTTEPYPAIRELILRDAMIQEDPVAVEFDGSPILDETGNVIRDEKGRVIYDDQ